jgi:ribosome maturation factor RimP
LRGFPEKAGIARFSFMGAKLLDSISKTPLEAHILSLSEKTLEPKGFRVVDVDCRVGPRSIVRLFIERAPSQPPTLDDCATASKLVSEVYDTDSELIPGAYDLEVSSPGLDRRLRLREDFEKASGQDLKLKLTDSIPGLGANVTGKLERVDAENVVMNVNKKEWPIPLTKVRQANIIWRF